jgi:hypothetical protein
VAAGSRLPAPLVPAAAKLTPIRMKTAEPCCVSLPPQDWRPEEPPPVTSDNLLLELLRIGHANPQDAPTASAQSTPQIPPLVFGSSLTLVVTFSVKRVRARFLAV